LSLERLAATNVRFGRWACKRAAYAERSGIPALSVDSGEDPACPDCGTLMMVAGREASEAKPDFITDAKGAGGPKSLSEE
jgi:hypothetical protein